MIGIDECSEECSEECGGNGWIACWDCGGAGEVTVADDDMTDMVATCGTCLGKEGWPCPVCEKREAFGEALRDHKERERNE